ncbi:asparaginase [Planctomycetota bacterium]
MDMAKVKVFRGGFVESEHNTVFVVVKDGRVIWSAGDAGRDYFMRSSNKSLQALPLILTGAADTFGFNIEEIAQACSSHDGEDMHIKNIKSMMAKCGLDESVLQCGPSWGLQTIRDKNFAISSGEKEVLLNNCSAKHVSMLATCLVKKWPLENYLDPEHPVQQMILDIISQMAEYPRDKIGIGFDYCGAPTHYLPLTNQAISFARLATPDSLDEPLRSACRRIIAATTEYPYLVGGTTQLTSVLCANGKGRFIDKGGGEAMFLVGVLGDNMGLGFKCLDGNEPRGLAPVVIRVIEKLGLLDAGAMKNLESYYDLKIKDSNDCVIGHVEVELPPFLNKD